MYSFRPIELVLMLYSDLVITPFVKLSLEILCYTFNQNSVIGTGVDSFVHGLARIYTSF